MPRYNPVHKHPAGYGFDFCINLRLLHIALSPQQLGQVQAGKATRTRVLLLVLATIVMASSVGGCGHRGPASDGPLNSGNSIHGPIPRGSQCVPGGRPQTFGFDQFTNYGHATVVLNRVVLLHPHNERLVGSYAVPGGSVLGVAHWPPQNPPTQPAWKDRQIVRGFRLAAGQTFNLVLGIAATIARRRATSQGELVYYHDPSGNYVAKSYSANIIAANTRTCM